MTRRSLVTWRPPAWLPAVAAVLACTAVLSGCRRAAPDPGQGPTPADATEVQTLADFQRRVNDYASLHTRIEAGLPALPPEATPIQIDRHQRDFGAQLAAARASARHGDLMTPAMQVLVRRHLATVFGGADAADLKGSVMDENPVDVPIAVNGRYPDEVPLSTMPPEVLQMLPRMPEGLEYRFVGRNLVIMDEHAHLIADYTSDAIPR
jgi:hypothetical protein